MQKSPNSFKWQMGVTFICWVCMLGFDFFFHAGLLSKLYSRPSPFLLPAEHTFYRIPLGYLSFFIFSGMLVWIMERLQINDWKRGFWFGLKTGILLWVCFGLGLYSISSIEWELLLTWCIGQALELGIAGMVAGAALSGKKLTKLFARVLLFVLVLIVLTVILQSLGFAPPMKKVDH